MRTIGRLRAQLADPVRRRGLVDALTAAMLILTLGVPSIAAATSFETAVAGYAGAAACLLMPAALAVRRTRPVFSAVAVYALALLHLIAGAYFLPVDGVVLAALYSVTVYGPRWARRAALAGALLGAALLGLTLGLSVSPGYAWKNILAGTLGTGGLVLAVWGFAQSRRGRMEHLQSLVERARRLEVERDQQAQLATAAERARIAREMHDVVAHTLSVVIAQADGGRYAAGADPAAAERALTTIAGLGRDALADIRRILGVLRDGDGGAALFPQPVHADLDALIEQVRSSGADVTVTRVGTPRPLPPGAALTVYRICQESLTNALKHAGRGARIAVRLEWQAEALALQVDDDGRGAAAPSDGKGQGLVGMRERAALFGGTLQAGPREGGFRVRAMLPLPTPAAPPLPLTGGPR